MQIADAETMLSHNKITHTNDLASLALTCAAMHSLVTPLIYGRFDIVWPDTLNSSEPRSGVDALTYGLATLVMREDLFENATLSKDDRDRAVGHNYSCAQCGMINHVRKTSQPSKPRRLRRGNYFSQFTKKFSLGNGPADWVQEYLVTKESGKMLGTLVALSLARMPNLESFVWDMPTGIIRDIWISLSSLADYDPSRLSKVWVRFHDNKTASQDAGLVYPSPTRHDNVMLPHSSIPIASMPSYQKLEFTGYPTEFPNFSTLPPLRSLTVLAIDEVAYLEELSVLIGRSRDKLRELRIGLASRINTSGYDAHHPTVQIFAAGTELALLLNVLYDNFDPRSEDYIYKPKPLVTEAPPAKAADIKESSAVAASETCLDSHVMASNAATNEARDGMGTGSDSTFGLSESMSPVSFSAENPPCYATIDPALPHAPSLSAGEIAGSDETCHDLDASAARPSSENSTLSVQLREGKSPHSYEGGQSTTFSSDFPTRQSTDSKAKGSRLKLETLELEGCLLNVFVLAQSIDFSMLTSLTLLHCEAADILWTQLSRQFPSPALKQNSSVVTIPTQPKKHPTVQKSLRRISTIDALPKEPKYHLSLKRIHTDTVSSSLITFLSKTLAANSLEWLFLQDNPTSGSPVTVEAIYKGPLRRHRASLTKFMVDSSPGASESRHRSTSALKWMLNRDLLTFITSGKMSKLRELAVVVDYKDWHFFLQRLPSIPHLRSLYVPCIANHVYGTRLNVRELAMGVVDVVTLRPEVQLCYLGISSKCFEILEKKHSSKRNSRKPGNSSTSEDPDDDSGDDDYHSSEDDDEHDTAGVTTPISASTPAAANTNVDGEEEGEEEAEVEGENDSLGSSEDEGELPTAKLKYRLREILFYDDKISIFRARHGRL